MFRPVVLKILGPPVLYLDDEPVSLSRKKSLALLSFLALEEGSHARDSLAALFWPECAQAKARSNLRSCVLDITEHINTTLLSSDREHVALIPGIVYVDALQFRILTRECADHDSGKACDRCAPALLEASRWHAGTFMEGFSLQGCKDFDDWQTLQGTLFQELLVSLHRRLCRWYESHGELEAAIDSARSWIVADSYDEEARRTLMKLLAALGRWAAADECYREWVCIAKNELGIGPDKETEELQKEIRLSRPGISELTSMVGREEAESSLRKLLATIPSGICTITGPGGVGKTRLARALFDDPGKDFPDGAIFVDISTVRDPALVISELAFALGVSQRVNGNEPLIARIISMLKGKRILLILDNFEQVLSGAGSLQKIAAACGKVSFLVTSRIHLGLENEIEFPLKPLESPREPDRFQLEDTDKYPAVRLLLERARSANHAFMVGKSDIAYAASICVRLDGLPLAIELAASRLGSYSLGELDEWIAQSSILLAADEPGKPVRHRSLNAAIEWGWELLDREEKRFLEALSVFSGGFDRAAAESVCCGNGSGGGRKDLLGVLVSWNLITRQELNGRSRFKMPEAIREFASDRLKESAAAASIPGLHAEYYLALATTLSSGLHRAEQKKGLSLLKLEHANFLRALDFFLDTKNCSKALDLAETLEWYWYRSGRYSEGSQALASALSLKDAPRCIKSSGRAFRARGWLLLLSGDWIGAREDYSRAAELLKKASDWEGLARALSGLGIAERWLGEFEKGVAHGKESVAMARNLGDSLQLAFALIWLYSNSGGQKIDEAQLDALNETLALSRIAHDPWCEAHALQGLGDYHRVNGDVEVSIACYEESLRLFESVGEDWMLAWTMEGLGMAEFRAGRNDKAKSRLWASFEMFKKLGDKGDVAYLLGEMGIILFSEGETEKGDTLLGASFALLRDTAFRPGEYATSRDIPSGLALHFSEAERRNSKSWKRGLILGFDRAVQEAFTAFNPQESPERKNIIV